MTNIIDSKSFNTVYNLDQMADLDWDEFCNDKTEERVKSIASRVYEAITSSSCNVEKVAKFTKNLELLNGKFKETRHIEPLTTHIQQLNGKLTPKKGGNTKVGQLLGQFETASKSNSVSSTKIMTPKSPSVAPKETIIETITKRFQNGISKLDINSLTFSQDLALIQSDVKKLKEKGLISENESTILEEAFIALKQGYSTQVEDSFLYNLAAFSPALGLKMDAYENCKKKVNAEARSELLKFVKMNCNSPATLSKNLLPFIEQAKETLSKSLVSRFLTEEQKKHAIFNKHFIDNFPALCKAYSTFQVTTNNLITDEINRIEKEYDLQSGNLFSPLVKHYSYMNLHANMSAISARCEKRFIKHIGLKNINEMDPTLVDDHLHKFLNWAKKVPNEEFGNLYNDNFKAQHEWLAAHAQHIIKAYNQSDDKEIPGKGCCFNNCLDRLNLFLTHPGMPPKEIPMQSTAKGRFAQMRTVHAFHVARKEIDADMTEETVKKIVQEAKSIENEAAHRLNLKLSKMEPITINPKTSQDPLKSLMREFKKICKISNEYNKGKTQFVLALYGPDGGHAINIQFDSSRNVFRFIDDNLGICEFTSIDDFATEFYSYMNIYYKDDKHFIIKFFEPK
jgi:hypothetical protein